MNTFEPISEVAEMQKVFCIMWTGDGITYPIVYESIYDAEKICNRLNNLGSKFVKIIHRIAGHKWIVISRKIKK